MKLLITGSNGQLGSELRRILGSGISELGEIPTVFREAQCNYVDAKDMDISDLNAVLKYISDSKPDIVINCAAYTNVDGCETNQDDAFRVNVIGARNLAISAESIGAKLVHVSTDYVFSGDSTRPYSELDICNPQSVYGTTKYLGEQYVRDFCTRYFIVRTAWLYGYKGKNFVKTIMKAAREKGELKVVNDQIGNPTNAADLAYHILKIASSSEYGIYHCTGSGECSWYDFACKIVEHAGINAIVSPCSTKDYPSKTKRPSYSALDNMMLRCTIGDEMRDWQDAIKYFIEHYNEE